MQNFKIICIDLCLILLRTKTVSNQGNIIDTRQYLYACRARVVPSERYTDQWLIWINIHQKRIYKWSSKVILLIWGLILKKWTKLDCFSHLNIVWFVRTKSVTREFLQSLVFSVTCANFFAKCETTYTLDEGH